MDAKEEAYQAVQAYLAQNKQRLQVMGVDMIVWEVRTFVPKASALLDGELRATVAVWRSLNGPLYPLTISPPPTTGESKLIEAVKRGVTTVIEGVDVKHGAGKINISLSGLTAELRKGDARLAAGVSWGGTLGVEAEKGDFHLSGELSSDRWEIKLSYPEDTAIPDLSKLGKVFGEGEAAMRNIIGATSGFRGLNDISRIKDAVKPHIQPVKDAVEAVQGIAKAPPKGGVSVGISLGSPDPLPGQTGIPPGVQGQVTLTIRF
jgi:hypothetical protein